MRSTPIRLPRQPSIFFGLSARFVVQASRLPSCATTFWAAGTAAPQSSQSWRRAVSLLSPLPPI